MTDPRRELRDEARKLADLHKQRTRDAAHFGLPVFGTVASYTAGPPRVVTVTIRDASNAVTVNWVGKSYTPTVGDRVLCVWVDNQLCVLDAGG